MRFDRRPGLAAKKEKAVFFAVQACGSLEKGKALHARVRRLGEECEPRMACALVSMYGRCGSMGDAWGVFGNVDRRDTVLWNALSVGYAENGEEERALRVLMYMQLEGCLPNAGSFAAGSKACKNMAARGSRLQGLEEARIVHSRAESSGWLGNLCVFSSVVDMYVKCGSVTEARRVFERMSRRDVVTWTTLIFGYSEGEPEIALDLYRLMQAEGCAPNDQTYVALVKACTSLAAKEGKPVKMQILERGMALHCEASVGGRCDSEDVFVGNTLIVFYEKCSCMSDARRVFDKMRHHTSVSWNALVLGYLENGEPELALELASIYSQGVPVAERWYFVAASKACTSLAVKEEGQLVDGKVVKIKTLGEALKIHARASDCGLASDVQLASSLVELYAACGTLTDARKVFDTLEVHDMVSGTALMVGYVENGEASLALELFSSLVAAGCPPDPPSLGAALKACGSLTSVETVKSLHGEILRRGYIDGGEDVLSLSLVDAYGKCGRVTESEHVFGSLGNSPSLETWSALITAYGGRGESTRVISLFESMTEQGLRPNGVTLLSVLTACSRSGLLDQGRKYFSEIWSRFGIAPLPDHYVCMIDILGRANELEAAVKLVESLPEASREARVVAWRTILGASSVWNNVSIGRLAYEQLVNLRQ